ncbi:MAG: DegT/DnrJ/EryC1/StrS family aminotransferase [Elusimicrobia bacterium]|nr:DegT/DnrJ/EryC1/StrS family aminotransferase [Elusimicrobiota bacterium]
METTQRRVPVRVPAFRPFLTRAESGAVQEAVESGWLGTGIYTRLFEERLTRSLGAPHAHAVSSGTAALHLALQSLGAGGGEVLTTAVTNVATNHAILYNRAKPVFCEVDPETGLIDPAEIERRRTRRTQAVVVVHLGQACDMDAVRRAAGRVPVVEDACACLPGAGASRGRRLGTLGDAACFSFGRFKGLTTIEGGAVVHARPALAERLLRLRRMGLAEKDGELVRSPEGLSELGWHYRLGDLPAALGLAQLERLPALRERLATIERRYRAGLRSLAWLERIPAAPGSEGVLGSLRVRLRGGGRDALRRHLAARGIGLNDPLYPSHRYRLYRPFGRGLPASDRFCAETLELPFYPGLADREVDLVLETLADFRRRHHGT